MAQRLNMPSGAYAVAGHAGRLSRGRTAGLLLRPWFVAELAALGGIGVALIDSPISPIGRLATVLLLGAALLASAATARGILRGKLAVAAIVGFVGSGIGIGYAAARLAEGSLATGLVVALAAVVSVGLLVAAMVAAVRRGHGLKRFTAVLAAAALVAAVLQFGFMPLAAATFGVHPPRMPLVAAPLPAASAVSLFATDGVKLEAWYTPPANGATVVLLPGALGNRGDTVSHARVLAERGYGVLAVDSRGSGDSGGIGNMWGWTGAQDIAGALAWLKLRPEVDAARIGLVGLSMGGEQSVTMAQDPDVSAVVAEGVQARMPGDIWYVADDVTGSIEKIVSTTMWTIADLWTDAQAPPSLRAAAAAAGRTPMLIIAADAPDERAVAADLADRAPTIEVWQTSGIGHTQALALAPVEWESKVVGFLDRTLLGR